MATYPSKYQEALTNWNTWSTALDQQGIKPNIYGPIAKTDLTKVAAGGDPMTRAEVQDALTAGIQGQPNITEAPSTGSGGFWDDLKHIGEAGLSDARSLVSPGLIEQFAKFAYHAPSELHETATELFGNPSTQWQTQHGYTPVSDSDFSLSGIAAQLRNVAHTPVGGLIPGLSDIANATTKSGRTQLQEHPLYDILDAAPDLAGEPVKAAGRALGGIEDPVAVGAEGATVADKLAQGRPLQAGIKAIGGAVDRQFPNGDVPSLLKPFSEDAWQRLATNTKVSHGFKVHARAGNRIQDETKQLANSAEDKIYKQVREPFQKELGLSPEEMAALDLEIKNNPDPYTRSPLAQTLARAIREHTESRLNEGYEGVTGPMADKLTKVVVGNRGTVEYYSEDSPVTDAIKATGRAERKWEVANRRKDLHERLMLKAANEAEQARGKVRRFGESDEEFNARQPGMVGAGPIQASVQSLFQSFRDTNSPNSVVNWLKEQSHNSDLSPQGLQVLNRLDKDRRLLVGTHKIDGVTGQVSKALGKPGIMDTFEEAVSNGEYGRAQVALTKMIQIFRKSSWDGYDAQTHIRDYLTHVRSELRGLTAREAKYKSRMNRLANSYARWEKSVTRVGELNKDRMAAKMFERMTIAKTPPQRWNVTMQRMARPAIEAHAYKTAEDLRDQLDNPELDQLKKASIANTLLTLVHNIANTQFPTALESDLERVVGKEEMSKIVQSTVETWMDLMDEGFDPEWIPNIPHSQFDKPPSALFRSRKTEEMSIHDVAEGINFDPSMNNIAAALSHAAVDAIRVAMNEKFHNDYVSQFVQSKEDLYKTELLKFQRYGIPKRYKTLSAEQAALQSVERDTKTYNPADWGVKNSSLKISGTMVISNDLANALHELSDPDTGIFKGKAWKIGNNIYKTAVLTGVRHLVHIGIGGTAMQMLKEEGSLSPLNLIDAFRTRDQMPPEIRGSTTNDLKRDADVRWRYAVQRWMGKVISSKYNPVNFLNNFEESIGHMQKYSVFIKNVKSGLSHDVALTHAMKTFVSLEEMSPFERTVLKQVFPFYAFTRHLFQFIYNLPFDHPMRVSILAHFANQEQEEWNQGLPQTLQSMFFLGHVNPVTGDITAVDFKNADPFRSFAQDLTPAGLYSGLTPAITGPMDLAFGINGFGEGDLYPDTTYDPESGTFVVSNPVTGGSLMSVLENTIPEAGLADHFLQITGAVRAAQQSQNPSAYRKAIFNALNLPFATSQVNIPLVQEETEEKRFTSAQDAVSAATKSGNFSQVDRFNKLPSSTSLGLPTAEYLTPAQLEQYWESLSSQNPLPGVNPRALIPQH